LVVGFFLLQAVAALIQALLTSKMTLTDAFVSRTDETMQILVTIDGAKTITVDEVASTDTHY
jgi:hypothetical protein